MVNSCIGYNAQKITGIIVHICIDICIVCTVLFVIFVSVCVLPEKTSECARSFLNAGFPEHSMFVHMKKCCVHPRAPLQFQICIMEKEFIFPSFYAIQQQKGIFYTDPDSEAEFCVLFPASSSQMRKTPSLSHIILLCSILWREFWGISKKFEGERVLQQKDI